MNLLPSILQASGIAVVALGAGLVYVPAGLIVAGVGILLLGIVTGKEVVNNVR